MHDEDDGLSVLASIGIVVFLATYIFSLPGNAIITVADLINVHLSNRCATSFA